jgi:peptidoglycan-N-acetylglucosamine deacetylase
VSFRVALTFDAEHPDRPAEPGNAERLLDVLASEGIRATFFLEGRWAQAYPTTARRIADAGHVVGSHSFCHTRMPLLSDAGCATDVRAAEAAILEHAGVDPRPWFRLPYGEGADDPVLCSRLEGLGYREVGWDVDPEDWEPGRTPADIVARVVEGVAACGDGAIVLQHTWPDPTWTAVAEVVGRLRDQGTTFLGVDELSAMPARHSS